MNARRYSTTASRQDQECFKSFSFVRVSVSSVYKVDLVSVVSYSLGIGMIVDCA